LKTGEATAFCVRAGLDFHLIDAEWEKNYMNTKELDRSLSFLRETESDLELILTINARHMVALETVRDYCEVIGQYGNGGFCFVVGNPTYLSEEERRLDAGAMLAELVTACRHRLPLASVFVGSEGYAELTSSLSEKYSTIPFALLDSRVPDKATRVGASEEDGRAAIYCPCYLSADSEMQMIRALGLYAMRRKWVREALRERGLRAADIKSQLADGGLIEDSTANVLGDAIRHLALCGMHQAEHSLRRFSMRGVSYVALLLAEDSHEEQKELDRLVSRLSS